MLVRCRGGTGPYDLLDLANASESSSTECVRGDCFLPSLECLPCAFVRDNITISDYVLQRPNQTQAVVMFAGAYTNSSDPLVITSNYVLFYNATIGLFPFFEVRSRSPSPTLLLLLAVLSLLVVACCCLLLLVVACCCLLLFVVACCCLLFACLILSLFVTFTTVATISSLGLFDVVFPCIQPAHALTVSHLCCHCTQNDHAVEAKRALDAASIEYASQLHRNTIVNLNLTVYQRPFPLAPPRIQGFDVVASYGGIWFYVPPMITFFVVLTEVRVLN